MKPQTQRVLNVLRQAGSMGVNTEDFLHLDGISHKFASRISELRRQGFVVEAKRQRGGSFNYRLISEPDPASGSAASGDPSGVNPPSRQSDEAASPSRSRDAAGRSTAVEPDAGSLFDLDEVRRPRNAALEDFEDEAA